MTLPAMEISPSSPLQKPWTLPAQGLAVFHGGPRIYSLSHYFLPRALCEGKRVLYLDGANRFNPLLLLRLARRRGEDARMFGRAVRVARAFTCFQLTELLRRAPRLLDGFPADAAFVTALPELYFDEDVREPDAAASFRQGLDALHRLAERLPVAVFSDPASFPTQRRKFFEQLKAGAGEIWEIAARQEDAPVISKEAPAPSALFPARR